VHLGPERTGTEIPVGKTIGTASDDAANDGFGAMSGKSQALAGGKLQNLQSIASASIVLDDRGIEAIRNQGSTTPDPQHRLYLPYTYVYGALVALQIANPKVVEKVERLAKAMGTTKTAAVEEAVDRLLVERGLPGKLRDRIDALLEQIDRIPDRSDAFDPLDWDERGLPK